MDSERRNSFGSKESIENLRRNSKDNTEYVPTRCRITKPIPPKPATNPMQFVKIGPCELYRKAQEQLKKVEEVKSVRPEIRDEAEDWQANLDNWKSSRRKRQEHIIERVVEVKKFEQQEQEKGRRKSKTFNEILEERSKRKNKLSISLYETEDPNDFSDYGIGGPKSESGASTSDINNINDNSSQSSAAENKEDEDNVCRTHTQQEEQEINDPSQTSNDNCERVSNISNDNCEHETSSDDTKKDSENENTQEPEQYTYESAIQGYRTRVISKNNLSSLPYKLSNNNNMDDSSEIGAASNTNEDVEGMISKGSILKRKELFENDKLYELNHFESSTSRRLSEDFINSQSLKERLLSLEKYTDQSMRHFDNVSTDSSDVKNNNTSKLSPDQFVRNRVTRINHLNEPEVEECEDSTKSKPVICNNWPNKRFDSPDDDVFVNQLENKQIHRSLDNLTDTTNENMALERVQSLEGLEYCHSNYPASNSSTELLAYGDTDREDSGIHTADVSCSVSQADEPVEDVVTEEEAKRTTTESNVYPVMQFDGVFASEDFPLGPPVTALEPPKEKPPPPPVAELDALDLSDESELKRLNSTKRIKKEMRMKRSSFLGIDPDLDDQPELEASIRKPPDINSFLQRESRLEKQLYKKSQSQPQTPTQSNYSEAGDSQDSGVELERGRLSSDTWCSSVAHTHSHSRQNSEPCTTNSLTSDEDEITKKEREIIELVEKEEKWRDTTNDFTTDPSDHVQPQQSQVQQHPPQEALADYITSEDDEHSEVLRVEHELLQLEREELERQRENMMFRESRARMQSKMCLKNKGMSLEDISGVSSQPIGYMYPSKPGVDYRKSMPELQREVNMATSSRPPGSNPRPPPPHVLPRTPIREPFDTDLYPNASKPAHPMSRHSLQMLSAAPRSRLMPQDNWIQPQPKAPLLDSRDKFNYNQHWLIQEAEQRRLSAQSAANWKLSRSEKHLPDAIIQTLTQRVQNKMNIPDRNLLARNVPHSPHSVGHALPIHHPHFVMEDSPDKMLSVSGKKKCSYCGNELGRGAAMIIESLCLFYHMDCFKCCVCHVQLGDGLMGTDVRVRNNKLHCHNCYSSDDGVKFSCV